MNFDGLAQMLRQIAGFVRNLNPPFGEDYWRLCNLLPLLHGCFVCPDCGGELQIFHTFCSAGEDYKAGHRAIWRCRDCGEMEIR